MIPDVSLGAKKWQLLPEDMRRVAILISGIVWPTSGTRHMKATLFQILTPPETDSIKVNLKDRFEPTRFLFGSMPDRR